MVWKRWVEKQNTLGWCWGWRERRLRLLWPNMRTEAQRGPAVPPPLRCHPLAGNHQLLTKFLWQPTEKEKREENNQSDQRNSPILKYTEIRSTAPRLCVGRTLWLRTERRWGVSQCRTSQRNTEENQDPAALSYKGSSAASDSSFYLKTTWNNVSETC